MNKQDIFKLYIGKCKIIDNLVSQKYLYIGYEMHKGKHKAVLRDITTDNGLSAGTMVAPIQDCTLLLKKLSKMSDEDKAEWNKLRVEYEYPLETKDISGEYDIGSDYGDTVESFLWLINNGYALSDEWFNSQDGNPIAEEV